MSGWAAKRFWKEASVEEVDGGFTVRLDGRAVKTPAKAALIVPTRALAELIAAEWDAQVETVDPTTMPATRAANAAIDKVAIQHAEVAEMLAEYGGTDLLCYRATAPEELIARQAADWDPLLDWAAGQFGGRLVTGAGVMHVPQDPALLQAMAQRVHGLAPFELTAFHDLVALSGSLVIAFAVLDELQTDEALWKASRIDETWQQEQWGADEEEVAATSLKRDAFMFASKLYRMVQK